jgi:hypothetical protein
MQWESEKGWGEEQHETLYKNLMCYNNTLIYHNTLQINNNYGECNPWMPIKIAKVNQ